MKTTDELMNDICNVSEIADYIEENEGELEKLSLSEFLQNMLRKYNMKKADLFRRAGIVGNNYGYEILQNDKKSPSRDVVLTICVAFPLTIEECQHALRCAGLAILYPRDKRDAYILYALKEKMSVTGLNDILEENGLKTLR